MLARSYALIAALAGPRDGVVQLADLLAAGLDPQLATREARAGRWRLLAPGTYLTSPGPPTLRQACYAADLHAGSKGMLTGAAGCRLRRLRGTPDATATAESPWPVHVLLGHATRLVPTSGVRVIRTRGTAEGTPVPQGNGLLPLPVAGLERCVADAIRACRELQAARAVATGAVRDRRLDWDLLEAAARRPGPGSGHLRQVVRDVADGVRSPAEGDLHDALAPAVRRGALPSYLLNPDVYLDGVLLGSPDAWFVGLGLGHEQDSREWHGSEDQLDATLVRHERWRQAGLHLDHVTPTRFRADPRAHLRLLADRVAERRRLLAPEPAGPGVVRPRPPLLPARTPWPQVDGLRAA
jgi:hypothetical protein